MPSRPWVWFIIVAWLSVTGYTLWREWQPYFTGQGAPPVAIDLADEAAQAVPIRWTLYRGEEVIGRLNTQMSYQDADDTFLFTHVYRQMQLHSAGVRVEVPELQIQLRLNRTGELLEQNVVGTLELRGLGLAMSAQVRVHGVALEGYWQTEVEWSSPWGSQKRTLPAGPLSRGQPLNPLLPVNRLAGLRPGRRWMVRVDDPLETSLREWLQSVAAQYGLTLPEPQTEPLVGEILREPQALRWGSAEILCWVIEYRRREELAARTYVQVSDGRVLMQEAFGQGEHVRLVRDP